MKTQIIVHITLKLFVCHNRLKLLKKKAPSLRRSKWIKEHICLFQNNLSFTFLVISRLCFTLNV